MSVYEKARELGEMLLETKEGKDIMMQNMSMTVMMKQKKH